MQTKGYWVLLGVMILAGALLISNYYLQRLPVVPDVNAQMSYSNNIDSYLSTGSYGIGNIGSYKALSSFNIVTDTGLICGGQTTKTCAPDCGWTSQLCGTSLTCSDLCSIIGPGTNTLQECGYRPLTEGVCDYSLEPLVIKTPSTSETCNYMCPKYLGSIYSGTTSTGLTCPGGYMGLFGIGSYTGAFCMSGSTSMFCPGGSTSLFCPGAGTYTALGCSKSDETSRNCYGHNPFDSNTFGICSSNFPQTSNTCAGTCGWCANPIPIGGSQYSTTQSPAW